MTDEQRLCIECGCPVHYGSRHHHCGMVAMKYMARISELERERDEARKDAEHWKEYAQHQEWCQDCAEGVSGCAIGSRLRDAAMRQEGK